MLLSLIPITLGLIFSLVSSFVVDPMGLLSPRALGFLSLALGLMIVFLVFGFGGLWKRKRLGYWIGLLFLAIVNTTSIYRFSSSVYKLLFADSNQWRYLSLGYRSPAIMIVDMVVQSVMLLLVLGLLLKVGFGKTERRFFSAP
jgi:hypothetical protein